ncbi:AraC family transcriptional regulator [Paenibacillus mucilaginosus]|uniref:GyrI-like domain-containing protein n=1 Tax=Paenibacillus mucilaginosus TaxID=61624 RepID=UPI003D24CB4A
MKPRIERHGEFAAVGTKRQHRLTEGVIPTIAGQWDAFMRRAAEIPGRGPATLGICWGIEAASGEPFDYLTGALVEKMPPELPSGMTAVTLEPRLYAVFTHRGPVARLDATYASIQAWLESNGTYRRADAPDFEYYDHRYASAEPESSEFDIYIPVTEPACDGGPAVSPAP